MNRSQFIAKNSERKDQIASPSSTNFYFSNLSDSLIIKDSDDNNALKFIIIQNDLFHSKLEQLTKDLKTNETAIENLEEERDNLEKQRLNLYPYIPPIKYKKFWNFYY